MSLPNWVTENKTNLNTEQFQAEISDGKLASKIKLQQFFSLLAFIGAFSSNYIDVSSNLVGFSVLISLVFICVLSVQVYRSAREISNLTHLDVLRMYFKFPLIDKAISFGGVLMIASFGYSFSVFVSNEMMEGLTLSGMVIDSGFTYLIVMSMMILLYPFIKIRSFVLQNRQKNNKNEIAEISEESKSIEQTETGESTNTHPYIEEIEFEDGEKDSETIDVTYEEFTIIERIRYGKSNTALLNEKELEKLHEHNLTETYFKYTENISED